MRPVSGAKFLLVNHFHFFNDDCSVQNRPLKLKLVPSEVSGKEDSNMSLKVF